MGQLHAIRGVKTGAISCSKVLRRCWADCVVRALRGLKFHHVDESPGTVDSCLAVEGEAGQVVHPFDNGIVLKSPLEEIVVE